MAGRQVKDLPAGLRSRASGGEETEGPQQHGCQDPEDLEGPEAEEEVRSLAA